MCSDLGRFSTRGWLTRAPTTHARLAHAHGYTHLIIVQTLSKNTSVRLPLNKVSHCTSSWPGARFGGDVHIGTRVSEACKRCSAVLLRVMHLVNSQPCRLHLSTGAGAGATFT